MGVLKRIFRLYDGIPFRSTLRPRNGGSTLFRITVLTESGSESDKASGTYISHLLSDIPHIPSKFVEIVPLSHRQGRRSARPRSVPEAPTEAPRGSQSAPERSGRQRQALDAVLQPLGFRPLGWIVEPARRFEPVAAYGRGPAAAAVARHRRIAPCVWLLLRRYWMQGRALEGFRDIRRDIRSGQGDFFA